LERAQIQMRRLTIFIWIYCLAVIFRRPSVRTPPAVFSDFLYFHCYNRTPRLLLSWIRSISLPSHHSWRSSHAILPCSWIVVKQLQNRSVSLQHILFIFLPQQSCRLWPAAVRVVCRQGSAVHYKGLECVAWFVSQDTTKQRCAHSSPHSSITEPSESVGRCFQPQIYEWIWSSGGMILTGKSQKTRGKTCPGATLPITNPTHIDLGSNLGLRRERPATNRPR
jgi:hypothetical protein